MTLDLSSSGSLGFSLLSIVSIVLDRLISEIVSRVYSGWISKSYSVENCLTIWLLHFEWETFSFLIFCLSFWVGFNCSSFNLLVLWAILSTSSWHCWALFICIWFGFELDCLLFFIAFDSRPSSIAGCDCCSNRNLAHKTVHYLFASTYETKIRKETATYSW